MILFQVAYNIKEHNGYLAVSSVAEAPNKPRLLVSLHTLLTVVSVRSSQIKRSGSSTLVPKYSISCLNLAGIVPLKNRCTGRPLPCRAGPLELTVLHTLHSLLPDILRNVPWDLFFPQRGSLEWQIASCHKVENINTHNRNCDLAIWGKWHAGREMN